jgi:hypothetical protein
MSIIRRWSSSMRGKSISTTILILIIRQNNDGYFYSFL